MITSNATYSPPTDRTALDHSEQSQSPTKNKSSSPETNSNLNSNPAVSQLAGMKRRRSEAQTFDAGSFSEIDDPRAEKRPRIKQSKQIPETDLKVALLGGTFLSVGSNTTYGLQKDKPLKKYEEQFLAEVKIPDGLNIRFVKEPAYFKDSSSVTPEDMLKLVTAERDDIDLFIHGTDTMADILLAYTLAGKSGIFVGSMYPSNSPDADGPGNAHDALILAAEIARDENHPLRGHALLVMKGNIFDPLTVRKGHTTSPDTFEAINGEIIGTIKDGRVTIDHLPTRLPVKFDLRNVDKLPHVVTYNCQAADSMAYRRLLIGAALQVETESDIEDFTQHGVYPKILMVEGYGHAKLPAEFVPELAMLARQGVIVVRSTSVPDGEVAVQPDDTENQFLSGGALTASKLRLLLRFAVADARKRGRTLSFAKLQALIDQCQPVISKARPA